MNHFFNAALPVFERAVLRINLSTPCASDRPSFADHLGAVFRHLATLAIRLDNTLTGLGFSFAYGLSNIRVRLFIDLSLSLSLSFIPPSLPPNRPPTISPCLLPTFLPQSFALSLSANLIYLCTNNTLFSLHGGVYSYNYTQLLKYPSPIPLK
jgi:hypothetical protein